MDKDLETAFSALEKEKANAMTSMDAQVIWGVELDVDSDHGMDVNLQMK